MDGFCAESRAGRVMRGRGEPRMAAGGWRGRSPEEDSRLGEGWGEEVT